MSALLEIENLAKSFGGVHAVRSCTFSVPEGQVTGLIGPNGAGKSTVVDLVSGFGRPDSGSVTFAGQQGELIFLADSFTTFTEPSVGRSAIELLELAGWQVRLESAGCCGRASLSKGLVDQARRMAAAMADRLGEAAASGVPIVGVEPSCLLTLGDEYSALLPGDPRAQALAAATRLPEELLVAAVAELRLFPAVRAEAEETIIAATGVSCRQQIAHGTGRPARHPLEIIRDVQRG